MIQKLFALMLLFAISGCTKKPQQLDVQVFVVTKGGENIKLGLVEVKAMPLEKALNALRPVVAERDAALIDLKAEEDEKEDAKEEELIHLKYKRKSLVLSARFAVALPFSAMQSSAKTDADGRCSLMLPPNQRWVISAVGERQAASELEHYVWIVEVPQKEGASNSLLLSNDNLLEDGANPLGLK